jgi:hypothetical protein
MSLFEKKEPEENSGILIDGSFTCMMCEEVVDEGHYLPVKQILGWICSQGHRSVIENFNLGV